MDDGVLLVPELLGSSDSVLVGSIVLTEELVASIFSELSRKNENEFGLYLGSLSCSCLKSFQFLDKVSCEKLVLGFLEVRADLEGQENRALFFGGDQSIEDLGSFSSPTKVQVAVADVPGSLLIGLVGAVGLQDDLDELIPERLVLHVALRNSEEVIQ